jgi:transcriptional regulator with PAS, ATPase and Fis domain
VLLGKEKFISADDLPPNIVTEAMPDAGSYNDMTLKEALAGPEKNIIRQALETNHWNRQATAGMLDINRTTLFKKMKQYGLYEEARRLGLT